MGSLKYIFLCIISCCILSVPADAQKAFEMESTVVGLDSFQNSIIALNDGGFATKNVTHNPKTKSYSVIITRFNACNQMEWSRSITAVAGYNNLNPYLIPYVTTCTQAEDSGLVVFYTDAEPYQNVIASKLSKNGEMEWSKRIASGDSSWHILSLSCTNVNNKGVVVQGMNEKLYHYKDGGPIWQYGDTSVFIVKLDNKGNLKWSKKYDLYYINTLEPYYGFPDKIISLLDNSFISCFKTYGGIVKLDSLGNFEWARQFNWDMYITSIAVTKSDGILIYGNTQHNINFADGFIRLIKIDKAGKMKWSQKIRYKPMVGGGNPDTYSVEVLANGELRLFLATRIL